MIFCYVEDYSNLLLSRLALSLFCLRLSSLSLVWLSTGIALYGITLQEIRVIRDDKTTKFPAKPQHHEQIWG